MFMQKVLFFKEFTFNMDCNHYKDISLLSVSQHMSPIR